MNAYRYGKFAALFVIVIVCVIAGTIGIAQYAMTSRAHHAARCPSPITYRIGGIDARFGVSREEFLNAIAEAADMWQKPLGRALFAYKPDNGNLVVNLVYDARVAQAQGTSTELSKGLYVDTGTDRHIDIYYYDTHEHLRAVLAHELGHVLGLEHNHNPQSVMYYLNKSRNTVLPSDIDALKALCS